MQYLGFVLLGIAALSAIVAFVQRKKGAKILATPFKKTGQVSSVGSGLVSFEGRATAGEPLAAPCSGTPCLYYEVQAEQKWEEQVATENGTKTNKGKNTIEHKKVGMLFAVDDGSGVVEVDASEGVSCDLKKTFSDSRSMGTGTATFGNYSIHLSPVDGKKYSTGVTVTERILPADQDLFVLGQLESGAVKKPKGMLASLMISTKGRDGLLGATKRNSIIAFAAAGVLVLPGGYFSIFGEPPVDHCENMRNDPAQVCSDKVLDNDGETYSWTVEEPGEYEIRIDTPNVQSPLLPKLSIRDAAGAELNPSNGRVARGQFAPGTYEIQVQDEIDGDPSRFQGGFSFSLVIDRHGQTVEAATPEGAAVH